jgi:hypothetical protein
MLRDARRCTESVVTKCVARARCASRRTPLERRRCDPSLTVGHLWRVIGNLTVSNFLVGQRDNENGDPSWISARIGDLLGLIRDLESEWTQDAVQRITTENTTFKQRLRQLSAPTTASSTNGSKPHAPTCAPRPSHHRLRNRASRPEDSVASPRGAWPGLTRN